MIGEEGRLLIEECMNPLVRGIYTTWMIMINLNVGVCVYMDVLTDLAARYYG